MTNGISNHIRAYWLWGTQEGQAFGDFHVKGRITIKEWPNQPGHLPEVLSKYLTNASVFATAIMKWGNSAARRKLFEFQQGNNGVAIGAYAIALSSPTMSVSIDLIYHEFHITLSGFGSHDQASRSKVYTAQGLHR